MPRYTGIIKLEGGFNGWWAESAEAAIQGLTWEMNALCDALNDTPWGFNVGAIDITSEEEGETDGPDFQWGVVP